MKPEAVKRRAANERKCFWCGSEYRHFGQRGRPWGADKEGRIRCPPCKRMKDAERMAAWREANREKIRAYAKADPTRTAETARSRSRIKSEDASIPYCKEQLCKQLGIPYASITEEMALLKREQLFLHRYIKEAIRVIKDKAGD